MLPSVLGSRRGNCSASPDIPEPLDFLIEGESQKKSQIDIGLDTSEQVPVEVQTSLLVHVTCVRRSAKCRKTMGYTPNDQYLKAIFVITFVLNAVKCNVARAKSRNMKEK